MGRASSKSAQATGKITPSARPRPPVRYTLTMAAAALVTAAAAATHPTAPETTEKVDTTPTLAGKKGACMAAMVAVARRSQTQQQRMVT